MKLSVDKIKKLKCPICNEAMEYILPPDIKQYRDSDNQQFNCKCGLKHTIWGLEVTDLQKEYDEMWKQQKQAIIDLKLFL